MDYDEPIDGLFPIFTKKDSILSALKRDGKENGKGQSSNPGRGLDLSLSFPFDLLRRRYLENLEKVNFQTQNIETLPDLKTCG